MKKRLNSILNAGVHGRLPNHLEEKVKLSNRLALVLMMLAIPFIFICFNFFRPITAMPILAVASSIFALILNNLRQYHLARIQLAVGYNIAVALFHAYLISESEPALTGVYMLHIVVASLPFVLFGIKELRLLLPVGLFSVLLFLCFDLYADEFELDLDNSVFKEGVIYYFLFGVGITGIAAQLLVLGWSAAAARRTSDKLLADMTARQTELESFQTELEEALAQADEKQKEEERTKWEAEGLAGFASILQSRDNLNEILDDGLSFLVKFMGAAIGAIYLVENKGQKVEIRMGACYAYDRKKYLNRTWEPGEGLVGQCYLEGASIYQTELPAQFITIKSGVGDLPPRALLVTPLMSNQEIIGFFELALTRELGENDIAFLEKLGENLALSMAGFNASERTRTLLRESQETSEMLRSQEEEMRQNMEELAATQEEMERREADREALLRESERKSEYIQLFQSMAAATNQASDVESATELCLELVCDHLDWAVGHAYFNSVEKAGMEPSSIWCIGYNTDFDAFRKASMETVFKSGEGLPGRVLETSEAAWIEDVGEDDNFPRRPQATALGLRSAMAFPVVVDGRVEAVLEFFSIRKEKPDSGLLDIMAQIGMQLSRVYVFKQFETEAENATFEYLQQIGDLETRLESYQEKFGKLDD